jgi:hypothetical protein
MTTLLVNSCQFSSNASGIKAPERADADTVHHHTEQHSKALHPSIRIQWWLQKIDIVAQIAGSAKSDD